MLGLPAVVALIAAVPERVIDRIRGFQLDLPIVDG
jgi:hypothetical protein